MSTYRISQLAEQVGVPATTLRFYEKEGLLTTARTPAGYRLYDDADADRVRFICAAKNLGLPLDHIRDLLSVWDGGTCREIRDELRPMITRQIEQAEQRIAELATFRDQLHAALTHLRDLPAKAGPCDAACEFLHVSRSRPPNALRPTTPARAGTATITSDADPAPVACSLDAAGYGERTDRWRRLLAGAERTTLPDGAMLVRLPAARAGELADLVVAEHECCPFFTFHLTLAGAHAELEARAPHAAEPLVDALFGPSEPTAEPDHAGRPR